MLGGIAGPMGALHGEFVVPKQGGGYQTLVVQHGKVTSVSSSTITVKSDDGFSATYAVSADALVNAARDGIGSIKKGDEVSVLAQQKSGNDAALQIGDVTRMAGLPRQVRSRPDGRGNGGGTRPHQPAVRPRRGRAPSASSLAAVPSALTRYRVMAYVTGVVLAASCLFGFSFWPWPAASG